MRPGPGGGVDVAVQVDVDREDRRGGLAVDEVFNELLRRPVVLVPGDVPVVGEADSASMVLSPSRSAPRPTAASSAPLMPQFPEISRNTSFPSWAVSVRRTVRPRGGRTFSATVDCGPNRIVASVDVAPGRYVAAAGLRSDRAGPAWVLSAVMIVRRISAEFSSKGSDKMPVCQAIASNDTSDVSTSMMSSPLTSAAKVGDPDAISVRVDGLGEFRRGPVAGRGPGSVVGPHRERVVARLGDDDVYVAVLVDVHPQHRI